MRVFPPTDEFVLKKSALPALEAETKHVVMRWIKKLQVYNEYSMNEKIRSAFCNLSIAKDVAFVTFLVVVVKVSTKLENTNQTFFKNYFGYWLNL